jgi:hypothetical protein
MLGRMLEQQKLGTEQRMLEPQLLGLRMLQPQMLGLKMLEPRMLER